MLGSARQCSAVLGSARQCSALLGSGPDHSAGGARPLEVARLPPVPPPLLTHHSAPRDRPLFVHLRPTGRAGHVFVSNTEWSVLIGV